MSENLEVKDLYVVLFQDKDSKWGVDVFTKSQTFEEEGLRAHSLEKDKIEVTLQSIDLFQNLDGDVIVGTLNWDKTPPSPLFIGENIELLVSCFSNDSELQKNMFEASECYC